MQHLVQEFHEAFGHGVSSIQGRDDREITKEEADTINLRRKLIVEEFEELMGAAFLDDVMKEACDLVYVILGMFVEFGWDFEEAFKRVHVSNMSKLDDEGNPIHREDGKVLKSENYEPCDLSDLV
jgi:predicted HAD superfamily Cof-like phosphohydrolase